jgi:hypothetical protein
MKNFIILVEKFKEISTVVPPSRFQIVLWCKGTFNLSNESNSILILPKGLDSPKLSTKEISTLEEEFALFLKFQFV